MPIDWLVWLRAAGSAAVNAKSIYDRVRGKSPRINFEAGDSGVELRIHNPRDETVIVEKIDAWPTVLGFTAGEELVDVERAVVAQRQIPAEHALAVLKPQQDASVGVITFDPFNDSAAETIIKVRLDWRSATRGMLSKGSVTRKVSVAIFVTCDVQPKGTNQG